MKSPDYQDELAKHLDAKEAPLPHPESYQFGYPTRRVPIDVSQARAERIQAMASRVTSPEQDDSRLRDFGISHPGPITLHEPRVDWLAAIPMLAAILSCVCALVLAVFPDALDWFVSVTGWVK